MKVNFINKSVIVTGSSGAIGSALVSQFKDDNFFVVGLDLNPPIDIEPDVFIETDLCQLASDHGYRNNKTAEINKSISGKPLELLVNNAAIQMLDTGTHSDLNNFLIMQSVNALAPLALYMMLKNNLKSSNGSMINIGSIHSILTKPGFAGYAASKASLRSITRSLAMESMGDIRIFSIEPAAIDTPMLRDGFQDSSKLEELKSFHPVGNIGTPQELAEFVSLLFSSRSKFLHGS